jgi:hypothetical protein
MQHVFDEATDCKRILRELLILKAARGKRSLVNLVDYYVKGAPETFNEIYLVLELAPCDMKKLIA